MSQRQLARVFQIDSFRPKTKPLKINSLTSRSSSAASSKSPFQIKAARIERARPAAAAMLERLFDDILAELPE